MKHMNKANYLDSNKTMCVALPCISTGFFPLKESKITRPDDALAWTQNIHSHSGSRAQMNTNLVTTSAVTLASVVKTWEKLLWLIVQK